MSVNYCGTPIKLCPVWFHGSHRPRVCVPAFTVQTIITFTLIINLTFTWACRYSYNFVIILISLFLFPYYICPPRSKFNVPLPFSMTLQIFFLLNNGFYHFSLVLSKVHPNFYPHFSSNTFILVSCGILFLV